MQPGFVSRSLTAVLQLGQICLCPPQTQALQNMPLILQLPGNTTRKHMLLAYVTLPEP